MILAKLRWLLKGRPYLRYPGYHCGCCGKWVEKSFSVPVYKSQGEWGDTWGLCEACFNMK